MKGQTHNRRFDRYVPRVLLRRLVTAPETPVLTLDGTVVFIDISGFTRLSERLARTGREGAEHLADTIGSCLSELLATAYVNGGSLLKFGGDALLIWFDGDEHPLRACASAVAMRRTLRQIGRIRVGGRAIVLRMSVGVHTGSYEMFVVGSSHREFLIAGPAVSRVVEMEAAATTGQILVSEPTASASTGLSLPLTMNGGTAVVANFVREHRSTPSVAYIAPQGAFAINRAARFTESPITV